MAEPFFRLDGRVAVVTGGGQGIGEAICRRLAAAGAKVAALDMSADNAGRCCRQTKSASFAPRSEEQASDRSSHTPVI